MDRIGAARALVDVAVKPLSMLKAPYLVLVGGYLVGQILVMVIPSAAGLVHAAPRSALPDSQGRGRIRRCGCGSDRHLGRDDLCPDRWDGQPGGKVAGIDPIIYLVQYQLVLAVPTLIVCSIAHYFVQRYYDRKGDDVYADVTEVKASDAPIAPKWYALFPVLPIVLLIVFSKLVVTTIKLDTVSCLFMVWIGVVIVEIVRTRSVMKVFKDAIVCSRAWARCLLGLSPSSSVPSSLLRA